MANFHRRESGTIRLDVSINGERFRPKTSFKCLEEAWVNQRVVGKNSRLVNSELDRIEEEVDNWMLENPVERYTDEQIEIKLEQIIKNEKTIEKRKSIEEYFTQFHNQKKLFRNKKTKKPLSRTITLSYKRHFRYLLEFEPSLELEFITETLYHGYFTYLTEDKELKVNTAGESIRRLKSFFIWCDKKGLPINSEYRFWKPINEETDEETRALNSEQLDRIYRLKIEPLEIYEMTKKLFGRKLNPLQVDLLCEGIENSRRQAVAMASIGPHKEDFWKLTRKNVVGNVIKYSRSKNDLKCVAPFRDTDIFHAKEYADFSGDYLFPKNNKMNKHLIYIRHLTNIPFHITAKTFRKTFGSIIWWELPNEAGVNKMAIIMKAYGHTSEATTRKYLGIQDEDLEKDHELLFG